MTTAYARGTQAFIDLHAIGQNVETFCRAVGPNVAVMAVVKADGYGHGAVAVARHALAHGASWLGVAAAEEGLELREAGLTAPILILGASTEEQVRLAMAGHLDLTVFEDESWGAVVRWAERLGSRPRIHLKVDTGMGRVGTKPDDVLGTWLPRLRDGNVVFQGLMSHLAESDAASDAFTRQQLSCFLDVIEAMRACGTELPPTIHLANSAAALRYPGTRFNLVRVGIALYGAAPYPGAPPLAPAMRLQTRVTLVKRVPAGSSVGYGRTFRADQDTTIATIAVGYADGYRRIFSNRAWVLIGGRPCPVVGTISMDQTTVAVPDDVSVKVGDPVILLGEAGGERIAAEDLAAWADTISYEIFTGISHRVPRILSTDAVK